MGKTVQTLNHFFSNQSNRRLTLGLTLLAACVVTAPFAMSYQEARAHRIDASSKADLLQQLRDNVESLKTERDELDAEINRLRDLTVSEETVESVRNQIVDLVRESHCHLRNVTVSERNERPWMEDDHVLADESDVQVEDFDRMPTGYLLQTQKLELSVSGEYANVQELITSIQSINRLLHTIKLDIQSGNTSEISVRWEMSLIGLVQAPVPFDDEFEE